MRMVNNLTGEIRSLHQDTTMYQVDMMVMMMMIMMMVMMMIMMYLFRCTNSTPDKRTSGDTSSG